uniref:Uncharacterized protein n=1 Tax=Molossus molossus TaxID=27622 RepID=A0A7J8HH90_MOLMO|nr:hypothetical protein HJG59_011080 [Molossus molossus]
MWDVDMEGMQDVGVERVRDVGVEGVQDVGVEGVWDVDMEGMQDVGVEGVRDVGVEGVQDVGVEGVWDVDMEHVRDVGVGMEGVQDVGMEHVRDVGVEGVRDVGCGMWDVDMEGVRDMGVEGVQDVECAGRRGAQGNPGTHSRAAFVGNARPQEENGRTLKLRQVHKHNPLHERFSVLFRWGFMHRTSTTDLRDPVEHLCLLLTQPVKRTVRVVSIFSTRGDPGPGPGAFHWRLDCDRERSQGTARAPCRSRTLDLPGHLLIEQSSFQTLSARPRGRCPVYR